MNPDWKNFVLAIVLSALIIIGWQYFFPNSMMMQQPAQQPATTTSETASNTAGTAATSGQTAGTAPAAASVSRDDALKSSPRIAIKSASLEGSINLKGARIDDLHLTKYRETIDPKSPTIVFLSPDGAPDALYAEQGLVAATGTTAKLPGPDTLWSASSSTPLSEASPLVLTWDNGEGLLFTRKIEVSDEYLFNISQSVENKGGAAVSLLPYGRIVRQDTPHVAGWWVFFEGMLGWLDGSLQEIH
ncbi:MAG: membrane protein insertase YidC, partial [Alphaproteobacteria bacterium]|nr:membrane protein insertase YidC [Alphaproteobacteria bacterium]